MSLEEFYKEAPPEISRPAITLNEPHQQTLARLDWELEQRKRWVSGVPIACSRQTPGVLGVPTPCSSSRDLGRHPELLGEQM